MENTTPRSAGRGQRSRQPTSRFEYSQLGNPSAGAAGGRIQAAAGTQHTDNVGVQVSNGDHVPVASASQIGGQRRSQASSSRAKSTASSVSSVSVRLKQNDLEAKEKIAELELKLQTKKEELVFAEAALTRAKSRLDLLKKRNNENSYSEDIDNLEYEIIDLQSNYDVLVQLVASLEASTQQQKSIVLDRKSLREEMIIEDDDSDKSSVNSEEKNQNVNEWIDKTNKEAVIQADCTGDFPAPLSMPNHEGDTVSQLVTALSQAFGSRPQQQSTVITKQVDKELPVFSGRPEDWLIFKNEFERTCKKYRYDDSENIVRLRKYVKGAARDAINHLLANPSNVEKVMTTLETRFGKPQFVLAALIDKAKLVKNPDVNKPESIVEFGTAVDVLVTNIVAFKMMDYLNNIQLLTELVDKLPPVLRRDWYRKCSAENTKENLESFQLWLSVEVDTAVRSIKPKCPDEEKKPDRGKRHPGINAAKADGFGSCVSCKKSGHTINTCFAFKKLNLEERWKVVRDAKLCFQCLIKGHVSNSCPNSRTCGIDGCVKSHHRLLHSKSIEQRNEQRHEHIPVPPQENNGQVDGTFMMASDSSLPMMYVKVTGPAGTRKVLALLDSACSFTTIEKNVAIKLGLQGEKRRFTFKVFRGKQETEESCSIVSCSIAGVQRNAQQYQLQNVKTIDELGIPGSPVDFEKLKRHHPYLRQAKTSSIPMDAPEMVIGYDNYRLFYSRYAVEGPHEDSPSAHRSRLGWYIWTGASSDYGFFGCETCTSENDKILHQEMKEFFTIENSGLKTCTPSRSKEDIRALELLEKHTKKVDKRWETCLLWREDNPVLPESKQMAIRRLQTMERKMEKDADFSNLVVSKFQDYVDKGYLVPADPLKKELEPSTKKWYLPWFFAYHPTKKPRLVYDAAAKSNGKSLNDFLLKGPDLLNSLPAVLMKFRERKFALTGDIKEMFHQVKLRQEDWPSQTVLFRGMDRSTEPQEYYMTVLFFGAASSPCSAIFAKNKNADLFRERFPDAVTAIHENFYMDDYLGSTETEEDAIRLCAEISEIHLEGGFEVVKWNSNSQTVLASIPLSLRAEKDVHLSSKEEFSLDKTLGMWWSPSSDQFQFKINLKKIPEAVLKKERRPTKREVTSVIMSLFDPLGFLSPVKVKALIIIQNIWKCAIGWDDEIPPKLDDQWNSWLLELDTLKDVKISRRMNTKEYSRVDMHMFVDASEEAYSCALYLRFSTADSVEMCFVAGKARVAPIKGLTIPRMELEAALMGSRLSSTVKSVFGNSVKIDSSTYWSDSKTVLCWLRSVSGRFKVYVQTRVGEIQELSNVSEWKWVPTKLNVADDATRSLNTFVFSSECRWLTGVDFLLNSEATWPKENKGETSKVTQEELEIRHAGFAAVVEEKWSVLPPLSRYSSWIRLIWATAAVFLAKRKFMQKNPSHITVEDITQAKILWIAFAQSESFPEELAALKTGAEVKKTSRLRSLSLAVNSNGLLVYEGRADAARQIGKSAKNPVILDPKHPYTKLWIQWLHEISAHQGQERVISLIRQNTWVLDCRNAVRRCWATCTKCNLRKLQPRKPEMGQLPVCRLGEAKQPFFHTGVDLFGPLQVKVNRGVQKRWGVIFTCMSTRAVHLDLVESLETVEIIQAISRFISIRGPPSHIWSDNGTNFVGANKELRAAVGEWNENDLRRSFAIKGIEWHFNPPASPHMGGSWERLIGIAKKIMLNLLKCQAPRESILRTVLLQAMDVINSRPLTYASADPDDSECITPNHLIKMKNIDGQPLPGVFVEGDQYRRAWRYTQHLGDEFWRRWTAEYLPTLLKREKWIQPCEPLKQGDVVFVVDDQVPRSAWKKGIVMEVFYGKRRQVRVVDVRVALGKVTGKEKVSFTTLRRHANKVIPLGLNCIVTGSHLEGGNVPASEQSRGENGSSVAAAK